MNKLGNWKGPLLLEKYPWWKLVSFLVSTFWSLFERKSQKLDDFFIICRQTSQSNSIQTKLQRFFKNRLLIIPFVSIKGLYSYLELGFKRDSNTRPSFSSNLERKASNAWQRKKGKWQALVLRATFLFIFILFYLFYEGNYKLWHC